MDLFEELMNIEDIDLSSLGVQTNPRNALLQIELEWYVSDARRFFLDSSCKGASPRID